MGVEGVVVLGPHAGPVLGLFGELGPERLESVGACSAALEAEE